MEDFKQIQRLRTPRNSLPVSGGSPALHGQVLKLAKSPELHGKKKWSLLFRYQTPITYSGVRNGGHECCATLNASWKPLAGSCSRPSEEVSQLLSFPILQQPNLPQKHCAVSHLWLTALDRLGQIPTFRYWAKQTGASLRKQNVTDSIYHFTLAAQDTTMRLCSRIPRKSCHCSKLEFRKSAKWIGLT